MLYISALIWLTYAIRHIKFQFHELKDLLRGIIISSTAIGIFHPGILLYFQKCVLMFFICAELDKENKDTNILHCG